MKSKPLPEYPATSAVIRGTVGVASEERFMRQARLVARAALYLSEIPLVEKVISVAKSQLPGLVYQLQGYDLHGFECAAVPDGLNLGDGQEYNERKLIHNPGQLILSDSDFGFSIENPRASYKLTPAQFGAEFVDASMLAAHNQVRAWSFCYRQSQGPFIGRQGMHLSVGTNADGFVRSAANAELGGFFLRNFIVLHKDAQGTWGSCPLLEDLYRCLSEFAFDPASLGRYYGTRVRFPDTRTNADYHSTRDWKTGKQILERDFKNLLHHFYAVFKPRKK